MLKQPPVCNMLGVTCLCRNVYIYCISRAIKHAILCSTSHLERWRSHGGSIDGTSVERVVFHPVKDMVKKAWSAVVAWSNSCLGFLCNVWLQQSVEKQEGVASGRGVKHTIDIHLWRPSVRGPGFPRSPHLGERSTQSVFCFLTQNKTGTIGLSSGDLLSLDGSVNQFLVLSRATVMLSCLGEEWGTRCADWVFGEKKGKSKELEQHEWLAFTGPGISIGKPQKGWEGGPAKPAWNFQVPPQGSPIKWCLEGKSNSSVERCMFITDMREFDSCCEVEGTHPETWKSMGTHHSVPAEYSKTAQQAKLQVSYKCCQQSGLHIPCMTHCALTGFTCMHNEKGIPRWGMAFQTIFSSKWQPILLTWWGACMPLYVYMYKSGSRADRGKIQC